MAENIGTLYPNIMLIDDEELTQTLIKHMLNELECGDIVIFSGSEKALKKLQQTPDYFDLVISDWEMPGMDGLEFLRTFRQFDKETPVLMVTGNTSRDLVMQAIKAGVNDFLGKPFTAKDLLSKVRKLVQGNIATKTKSY